MRDVTADLLSRYFLDPGELPVALPRDAPWLVIGRIGDLVLDLIGSLPPEFERISAGVAVHRSATVASSALVTGPVILSARCRVGHGAVLRGGVWAGEEVTIGPHSEIKGSLLLARSAAAHRNYVGDSTGLTKFGALIGDSSRIGANAVTSPGTLLPPGSVVPRLGLVDQLGTGGS